jgi:hypothetical protein
MVLWHRPTVDLAKDQGTSSRISVSRWFDEFVLGNFVCDISRVSVFFFEFQTKIMPAKIKFKK